MNGMNGISRILVIVLLSPSACVWPADVVAEYVGVAESGQSPPPSCIGDCPCTNDQCVQYCADPESPKCGFQCAPGATCEQSCTVDVCTSECVDAAQCDLDCAAAGTCQIACFDTGSCSTQCSADCTGYCEASDCDMSCPGGGCLLHCRDTQSCVINDCPFGCTLICENVAECQLLCTAPESCAVIIR
jgi:hypothetical protein